MKRPTAMLVSCLFVYAGLTFGLAQESSATSLTVNDVVTMLEARLPEQVVLAKIESYGKPFTLSTEDLVRLKQAGATGRVMVLMMDPSATANAAAAAASPSGPTACSQIRRQPVRGARGLLQEGRQMVGNAT